MNALIASGVVGVAAQLRFSWLVVTGESLAKGVKWMGRELLVVALFFDPGLVCALKGSREHNYAIFRSTSSSHTWWELVRVCC